MTKGDWIVLLCIGLLFLIAAMPSKGAAGSWREMLGIGSPKDQTGAAKKGGADPSGGVSAGDGGAGAGTGGWLYGEEDTEGGWLYGEEGTEGGWLYGEGGTEGEARETAQGVLAGKKENGTAEGGSLKGAYPYTYEALMERRVKEVLAKVEGVGEVDVLIVLKSSEQKVYQIDGSSLYSSTKEQDSSGGSRELIQQEEARTTVLAEGGGASLQAGLSSSGLYKGAGGSAGSGESGNDRATVGEGGSGPLLEKEIRPEVSGIVISAQGGGEAAVKAEITAAMEALFDLPAHKIKVLKRAK